MFSLRSSLVVASVVLASGFAAALGGWAVTTVEDLPERFVAGEPIEIAYVVRQHGLKRIGDLTGHVVAKNGRQTVEAPSVRRGATGRYASTLRLPRAGQWTITIHNGFGPSTLTLLPVVAVERGARHVAVAELDRGRQLFVAKGCVQCHTHAAINGQTIVEAGPNLTMRRFPADYLAKFLADPAALRPSAKDRMPALELKDREIAALVAFVNANSVAAR